MDEAGDLMVVGRISKEERFKVNGDVVYGPPIETVMRQNPHIHDIAVLGRNSGTLYGHEIIYCIM